MRIRRTKVNPCWAQKQKKKKLFPFSIICLIIFGKKNNILKITSTCMFNERYRLGWAM